MPAYSFKERFVPMIKDRSKRQTIRAEREGRSRHAKPGQTCYLYFAMRTKWCTKLLEGICNANLPVMIDYTRAEVDGTPVPYEELDAFAWRDGFRPEDSTEDNCPGAWNMMQRFWRQTHKLPFYGRLIMWD